MPPSRAGVEDAHDLLTDCWGVADADGYTSERRGPIQVVADLCEAETGGCAKGYSKPPRPWLESVPMTSGKLVHTPVRACPCCAHLDVAHAGDSETSRWLECRRCGHV